MKKKHTNILIIDDNEELLVALKLFLTPHFGEIKTIKSPNQALSLHKDHNFDIILLDMNFKAGVNSGNEGIFWMNEILKQDPLATIVLITAYGDIELAVRTIKEGAADFIQKSWDENKILSTLLNVYKLRQSKLEINKLKQKQKHLSEKLEKTTNEIIGNSPAMLKVFDMVNKVAGTDANVLISGENGTGKEVIAKEIHRKSQRAKEIFVSVDVGALSESLFESELFGHKKGSFTDAKEDRTGRFEIASGGTLFLDEIGNIPLHLQAKLLSAIQNQEITPVGASHPISIDARLICATNSDLTKMIEQNNFREDLLYRINTIQIIVPPLRDRKKDIPLLAKYFLSTYSDKYCKTIDNIDNNALKILEEYPWKGNVRELQHAIEKAIILSDNSVLTSSDFSFIDNTRQLNVSSDNFKLADHEKEIISKALNKCEGNLSKTAKILGINRSTLYEKIRKYDI